MMIIEPPALKNSIKISTSLRNQILERDDYTCQECGATEEDEVELQVDHKIPRSKGGSNEPSNLQVLCFDCNNEKSDNLTL
jgi:5-methylcytosine-specific restriction endonuclease McrA